MDAFTISFHRCYLLLSATLPPPSYYSLHCVTLHYTAASCGCCNGSAAAAASAQLCNCSDTSSSVMNSCLFRLCCIFLTSCKGSGALLLHFPSSRSSSSSSCNEWSGKYTHLPSAFHPLLATATSSRLLLTQYIEEHFDALLSFSIPFTDRGGYHTACG